jgi:hypothetical protein
MSSTMNSTLFDKVLKEWYAPGKLESMLFKQFPYLEKVKKEKAGGKYYVQPVLNGANVRRSASYAFTQNSITHVAPAVAFQVPYMEDYCTVAISSKLWRQSESDPGAFISAFKQAQDSGIAALRKSLALKLYRSGTGSIGQLGGSSTAATVQALANRADAFNFEVGDIVATSETDGGLIRVGLPAGTTGAVIAGIQDNGTTASLVFAGVLNTAITDVANADYLYSNSGDAKNNASTATVVTGMLGWSPATTTSLTVSFFGVTRSTDERRLRGQYVANSNNNPIDEQLQNGITQLVALGGMPDSIFLNPQDVLLLQKVASGKVMRDQGGSAKFGFKTVIFASSSGDITVYSDPACPQGLGFIADMSGHKVVSLGEPIGIRKQGDATTVRSHASLDAWIIDWMSITNLVIEKPGQQLCTVAL